MNAILKELTGGDLRSEGRAEEIAERIIEKPALLPRLAEGLSSEDKLIRARTCMAMEIISRQHSHLLKPVRSALVELAMEESVPQARWHLAEIFASLAIPRAEARRVIPVLLSYLEDKSKIVRHCAILALGILGANSDQKKAIIERITAHGDDSKGVAKAVTQALDRLR